MGPRVLVLGGYGAFGARVAERLARTGGIELLIAGRSGPKAKAFAESLRKGPDRSLSAMALDAREITAGRVRELGANIVINASGPYQEQDYRVARAAIEAGAHYVDLADARDFATGITALDAEAKAAGVLAVSGASTVPALSSAVVDHFAPRLKSLRTVRTVISPGNSFDPGLATARSVLASVGRPIAAMRDGRLVPVHGWQGLERIVLPGLGLRWISDCDAPDLALFPRRYPGVETVRVCAALEVGMFHLGLWAVSGLVRAGLLRNPERLAGPLLTAKRQLGFLGSDRGGMVVSLEGIDQNDVPARIDWFLVAKQGHGPNIPAIPAVILVQKLIDGSLATRGAMPCVGLFTLEEFRTAVADLSISDGVA